MEKNLIFNYDESVHVRYGTFNTRMELKINGG